MLALIPLFSFVGFALHAFGGRRVSKPVASAIACGSVLLSFAVSVAAVLSLIARAPEQRVIAQTLFTWITSGSFGVDVSFALDPLASVMILVVTGIEIGRASGRG